MFSWLFVASSPDNNLKTRPRKSHSEPKPWNSSITICFLTTYFFIFLNLFKLLAYGATYLPNPILFAQIYWHFGAWCGSFLGLVSASQLALFSCLISLLEPVFGHLLNLPKWVTHHRGLFKIGSVHRLLTTTFYGHIAQSVHQLISRQVQSARHTAREEKPNKAKPRNWAQLEAIGPKLSALSSRRRHTSSLRCTKLTTSTLYQGYCYCELSQF